jgi:hypothetical protein
MRSGIETIDGDRYWNNGTNVLKYILAHAKEYKIKFVFCASLFYSPRIILEMAGWEESLSGHIRTRYHSYLRMR